MDCQQNDNLLRVETPIGIYEIEFGQVQIEITGKCNMSCLHCRASNLTPNDMPIEQIVKILRFARQFSGNYKEVILSGGEPLLHKQFYEVLKSVRNNGGESITLTTNGSFFDGLLLEYIHELGFKRVVLSVSLDSVVEEQHDEFRNFRGAFKQAIKCLREMGSCKYPEIIPSMRSTLQAKQIPDMERFVLLAKELGCRRLTFSSIHPAGRAITNTSLWMSRDEKRLFLEELVRLRGDYKDMNISTNDPLKCLCGQVPDTSLENELVFDGCGAGVITFNVTSDGIMTPCALVDVKMMEVFGMTIEQMTAAYQSCQLVKDMLDLKLKGKCGVCDKKRHCVGCRARAYVVNNDFFGEDPHCFK